MQDDQKLIWRQRAVILHLREVLIHKKTQLSSSYLLVDRVSKMKKVGNPSNWKSIKMVFISVWNMSSEINHPVVHTFPDDCFSSCRGAVILLSLYMSRDFGKSVFIQTEDKNLSHIWNKYIRTHIHFTGPEVMLIDTTLHLERRRSVVTCQQTHIYPIPFFWTPE